MPIMYATFIKYETAKYDTDVIKNKRFETPPLIHPIYIDIYNISLF